MAISLDRLSLNNLTEIPVSNYTTASDTTAINNTRSLSDSYTASSLTSALSNKVPVSNNSIQSALGLFNTNCNTSSLSAQQRSNLYNNRGNRNMSYGGSTLCPNGRSSNGLDGVLGNINSLKSLANTRLSLPSLSTSTLTDAITNTVTNIFGGTIGGLVGIPLCLFSSVADGLLKTLGNVGGSLTDKLGLGDLFNSKLAQCLSKAVSSITTNNTLTRTTTGSVINNLTSTGVKTAGTMMDSILGSGTARSTLYDGFGYAFGTENDTEVETKLSLYNSVVSTDTDNDSLLLSQSYTKNNIDNIINNIDNTDTQSTFPSGDYDNIITGLNNVDSSWNKDGMGDINYFRTDGNGRLVSLSETNVLSNNTTETTGSYKTDLTEAESIYILNSVS